MSIFKKLINSTRYVYRILIAIMHINKLIEYFNDWLGPFF